MNVAAGPNTHVPSCEGAVAISEDFLVDNHRETMNGGFEVGGDDGLIVIDEKVEIVGGVRYVPSAALDGVMG